MAISKSDFLSSSWADGIFAGRVLFITGGAGTIGSVQTRAFVHLGGDACIIGRSVDRTEAVARQLATTRDGAKVIGLGGVDVRNFGQLSAAADRCVRELGAIDFVIAGAAGNFACPISAMSSNAFKTVLDIDTVGTFNTIKATIPYLVASAARNRNPSPSSLTGGRIIAVTATLHYTATPLQAHVMAAKAGVDALMASVALEYGPLGVTANSLAPGGIQDTEGMARLSSSEMRHQIPSQIPLQRWGTVRDIADATIFLLSDAANYVNGTTLVVDGAAWRRQGALESGIDPNTIYPKYLLSGDISKSIRSGSKESPAPKL